MAQGKLFELELEMLGAKAELEIKSRRGLASAVGAALVIAAIREELRKPAAERQWHGRLWDAVPYEFRPPTLDRLREAYWAPADERLFTETAFGVGWALNMARLGRPFMRRYRDDTEAISGQAAAQQPASL